MPTNLYNHNFRDKDKLEILQFSLPFDERIPHKIFLRNGPLASLLKYASISSTEYLLYARHRVRVSYAFFFNFSQHSDEGSIDPILLRNRSGIGPWIKKKMKEGEKEGRKEERKKEEMKGGRKDIQITDKAMQTPKVKMS